MSSLKVFFFSAFLGAASALPASAQYIERNAQGYAQCPGRGNNVPSGGGMPTTFANKFWAYYGCGFHEEAFSALRSAPKGNGRQAIPSAEDTSPLAQCYYRSLPHGTLEERIVRQGNSPLIAHGAHTMDEQSWRNLQQGLLFACEQAITSRSWSPVSPRSIRRDRPAP